MKQRGTRCHRALMTVLGQVREEAGLSQRAVSAKLRRPINFSHLVESGERTLSVCEFIEYVSALGADPVKVLRRVME